MEKKKESIYRILVVLLLFALILSYTPYDLQAAVKCKSVKMNVTKGTIGVGEVLTLNAITTPLNATGKQSWTSSNKRVATVTQYGAVTGIKEGTATITVKISGKKATCKVVVTKYATTDSQIDMSEYVKKNELTNYANKKNTYTKDEINRLIDEKMKIIGTSQQGTSQDSTEQTIEKTDNGLKGVTVKYKKSEFINKDGKKLWALTYTLTNDNKTGISLYDIYKDIYINGVEHYYEDCENEYTNVINGGSIDVTYYYIANVGDTVYCLFYTYNDNGRIIVYEGPNMTIK